VSEKVLLARASRRYGLVEWSDATRLVSEKWLRHAVREQRLIPVHPAVYRFAAAPISREQRLLAACLAAGPGCAVSHRAAAHEWGLAEFPDVVEIVTPRAQWPRLKGVRVHRSTDLREHHVTTRHGLPITKPLRTLVDLGQSAPWAVADGLELGLANRLFGIKAADAALDEFAYPEYKIAIEVDGFDTRRTPEDLDRSNARQNELVLLGWTVLRFSWKHVVRQPDKVAQAILVTLAAQEGRSA
jgi:hypothetical protein